MDAIFHPDQPREGEFSPVCVFSGPFTHDFLTTADIEEIVNHLKGETYIVAITFEAFKLQSVRSGNHPPQTKRD